MIFEKQITAAYQKQFAVRSDDTGLAYYFSPSDFEGLSAHPYSFDNGEGHRLQGYFYHYDAPIKDRLVVFDHGFGGGHRSYMKEIECLCKRGYTVFSYDHTGCMESQGPCTYGLGRSLSDLDACFRALKGEAALKNTVFSVMGHSWGGYSAMNITALHPEIAHVVVLSGFVSVKKQLECFFSKLLKGYRLAVYRYEQERNGKYAEFDGVESLKNTKAQVLLVYSANDALVQKAVHYDLLVQALKEKDNVRFLLEEGKGHNPNYTAQAVGLLGQYLKAAGAMSKKTSCSKEEKEAFVSSFDFDGMTAQDETVWREIFRTLEG